MKKIVILPLVLFVLLALMFTVMPVSAKISSTDPTEPAEITPTPILPHTSYFNAEVTKAKRKFPTETPVIPIATEPTITPTPGVFIPPLLDVYGDKFKVDAIRLHAQ